MKQKKFELNVSTLRKLGDQDTKQVAGATYDTNECTNTGGSLTTGTRRCTRPPQC